MVDDDDGDGFPSPEPRTDSRSALPRGFRACWRLHIVKRNDFFSLIFSPRNTIYRVRVGVGEAPEGPRGRGHALGGQARPHPCGQVVGPLAFIFCRYFLYFPKSCSVEFQVIPKTASVRVSSIQIMQVRVQNKAKSVWKSRYDGDVSGIVTWHTNDG